METNISDTPITDAAYFDPCSTTYSIAGEMKKLERQNAQLRSELLACYNRIPGIEQINQLPETILSGTVSDTIHAYGMMQEKKVGLLCDALDSAWSLIANVDEGEWIRQTRGWIECATKWRDDQLTPNWNLIIEHHKENKS